MDTDLFDRWTRSISTLLPRRTIAGALGLGALALPALTDAKKKKRKKNKKIKRNSFGCVNVGNFCKNAGQCCSGICKGKKGKKACKAHDASTCAGQNSCVGELVECTTTAGVAGACEVTTGNASYCEAAFECFDCTKDVDCEPICGAGAACILCANEACVALGLETACVSFNDNGCSDVT